MLCRRRACSRRLTALPACRTLVATTAILGDLGMVARLALRTFAALAFVGAVVAGVTTDRRHRAMTHGVGREARRRIGMAVAALNRAGRNVGRRGHPSCGGSVVAS